MLLWTFKIIFYFNMITFRFVTQYINKYITVFNNFSCIWNWISLHVNISLAAELQQSGSMNLICHSHYTVIPANNILFKFVYIWLSVLAYIGVVSCLYCWVLLRVIWQNRLKGSMSSDGGVPAPRGNSVYEGVAKRHSTSAFSQHSLHIVLIIAARQRS